MAHNLKHHWSCWYKTEAGPSYQLLVYNMKYSKSTKPIVGKTMNIKDRGMKELSDNSRLPVLWRCPRTFHRISMLSVLLQTEQEQWNAERDSEKKTTNQLHSGKCGSWETELALVGACWAVTLTLTCHKTKIWQNNETWLHWIFSRRNSKTILDFWFIFLTNQKFYSVNKKVSERP